jgi:hypothetical protein
MNDDTGGSRDRRRARILAADVAGIALLPNGGQDTAAQRACRSLSPGGGS